MSSILSILLVIVMAFSSIGGATAVLEEPASFDAKINVDADALLALAGNVEVTDENKQAISIAGDVLNALTLKGVASKDSAELDLFAGEDVLLSIGVKNAEDGGLLAASSLLGSQVISVSAETIQGLQKQMMASSAGASELLGEIQNVDQEQLAKDIAEVVGKLSKELSGKLGETETGEFTVDDMVFTKKTPVNITYTEATELLLNSVKELLGKESMKPFANLLSQKSDVNGEIDKAIEKIKNQPEKEKSDFSATVYADDNGNTYGVFDLTKTASATGDETQQGQKIHYAEGLVDGKARLSLTISEDKKNAELYVAPKDDGTVVIQGKIIDGDTIADIDANCGTTGNLDMTFNITSKDMTAKIVAKTEASEGERTKYFMDVFMNNGEKPLVSVIGSAGKGGEPVSVYEGEDVTILPFETLMNDTDGTASGKLQMTLTASALKAITVLTKNLPEETATWLSKQVMKQMMPKSTTTVEPKTETVTGE